MNEYTYIAYNTEFNQEFKFNSLDEYHENLDYFAGLGIETFQFSSRDDELFNLLKIDQCEIGEYFELLDDVNGSDYARAQCAMLHHSSYNLEGIRAEYENVILYVGDSETIAAEMFWDQYGHEVPEHIKCYIDTARFCNDLKCGGEFYEFEFEGCTYTCTNANDI